VIHIDADVQEEPGFDVPRREGGNELSIPDRVNRIMARLSADIDAEFYQTNQHRIVFAVTVETIECWLLPLLYNNNKATKTTGCLDAANHKLRKADNKGLSGPDGTKFPNAYEATSREYQKRKTLMKQLDKQPSLGLFIQQLDALQSRLSTSPPTSQGPGSVAPESEKPPGDTVGDQPG
jgi:hypothetical protein